MQPQSLGKSKVIARNLLKLAIVSERKIFTPRGYYPICPICGQLISDDPDMHEALITKGMVSGNEYIDMINSRANCVLRHHICPGGKQSHLPGTGSQNDYENCVDDLVKWNGIDGILAWFYMVALLFPHAEREARFRFLGYVNHE